MRRVLLVARPRHLERARERDHGTIPKPTGPGAAEHDWTDRHLGHLVHRVLDERVAKDPQPDIELERVADPHPPVRVELAAENAMEPRSVDQRAGAHPRPQLVAEARA